MGELLSSIDKVASFSKDSNRRSRFNRYVSHATLRSQRTSVSKSSNASERAKKAEPEEIFNRTTSFTEFSDVSGNENAVSLSLRSIGVLPNLKKLTVTQTAQEIRVTQAIWKMPLVETWYHSRQQLSRTMTASTSIAMMKLLWDDRQWWLCYLSRQIYQSCHKNS